MSSDPFDRVTRLLAEAREERDTAKRLRETDRLNAHQLRRRLEVAAEQNKILVDKVAEMQHRLEAAEQQAERSRRAMLDHAGRR